MPAKADKYTYQVEWSLEDKAYVARCLEFPSLTAHGGTHEKALSELKGVVSFGLGKLEKEKQPIPEPLGEKKYSGEFRLRVGKGLHRELAIDAASEGLSLNTLVLSRLRDRPRRTSHSLNVASKSSGLKRVRSPQKSSRQQIKRKNVR